MADRLICDAEGCGNEALRGRKGYCGPHYKRAYKHGRPDAGKRAMYARAGEPAMWLMAHVSYQGDDCLTWPFAQRGNGYGILTTAYGKSGAGAHRHMCELAHGDAPSDRHLAAHRCGKGHLGCVNPRHLRWATPKDNALDRAMHGTSQNGESNSNSTLTTEQVVEMRGLAHLMSQNELARRFGVTQSTVWRILHRKAWSWLV